MSELKNYNFSGFRRILGNQVILREKLATSANAMNSLGNDAIAISERTWLLQFTCI